MFLSQLEVLFLRLIMRDHVYSDDSLQMLLSSQSFLGLLHCFGVPILHLTGASFVRQSLRAARGGAWCSVGWGHDRDFHIAHLSGGVRLLARERDVS